MSTNNSKTAVGVSRKMSNSEFVLLTSLDTRYRTIFLKRLIQGLVFWCILKDQESKSWVFFEGPRRFRGPQKSEKVNLSKLSNKSVDHKFKSFAINSISFSYIKSALTLFFARKMMELWTFFLSCFWGPLKLLKPLKKAQILDSWHLNYGLYGKSVLYLLDTLQLT